ncbi:hypothetical protein Purlil1_1962 [Purpureocillium lilacinum]|uniref:Uncharacterized protein n=1 Tax=Purpureocillium lilacinum TaxID=33203 RepID=A0ABR0CB57_PURLI|nr:hypothetical protein Purlil1_1962 [Purpureocillium lilacinum]
MPSEAANATPHPTQSPRVAHLQHGPSLRRSCRLSTCFVGQDPASGPPNPTSPDGGTAGSPTRAAQSWAHQGTQRRVDWDQQTPSRIAARHDTRIPTRGDANCCRQDEPCAVQREARGAWASEATWRLLQPLRPALAVLPLRGVCQVTVRMLVETLDLRARIEVEMSRILICGDIVVEV